MIPRLVPQDIPTCRISDLIRAADAGLLSGSQAAFRRLRQAVNSVFEGVNGYGDYCFDIGRLPQERARKRLYIQCFSRPNAAGAVARIVVQAAP